MEIVHSCGRELKRRRVTIAEEMLVLGPGHDIDTDPSTYNIRHAVLSTSIVNDVREYGVDRASVLTNTRHVI